MYDRITQGEQILSGYDDTRNMTADLLKRTQANYSGLVTMCNRWFGYLYETIKNLGLIEDSAIIVTSDHGHSIGDNNYMGKRGYPSSPEVYEIPLIIRHPKGKGAGKKSDILAQHHDLFSTILGLAGVKYDIKEKDIAGIDFWGHALENRPFRDHVTIGWGPAVTVIQNEWWLNCKVNGKAPFSYNLQKDHTIKKNLTQANKDVVDRLFSLAVKDDVGNFPDYLLKYAEETEGIPGCSPIAAKIVRS